MSKVFERTNLIGIYDGREILPKDVYDIGDRCCGPCAVESGHTTVCLTDYQASRSRKKWDREMARRRDHHRTSEPIMPEGGSGGMKEIFVLTEPSSVDGLKKWCSKAARECSKTRSSVNAYHAKLQRGLTFSSPQEGPYGGPQDARDARRQRAVNGKGMERSRH